MLDLFKKSMLTGIGLALKTWDVYATGKTEVKGSLAWHHEQDHLNALAATSRLADGLPIDVGTLYRLNATIELTELVRQSINRYSEHTQMTFLNAKASLQLLLDQAESIE